MPQKFYGFQKDFMEWLIDREGADSTGKMFNDFFSNREDIEPWKEGDDILTKLIELPTQDDLSSFVTMVSNSPSEMSYSSMDEYTYDYDPVDSGDVIYIGDDTYMSSCSDAISGDPWDLVVYDSKHHVYHPIGRR